MLATSLVGFLAGALIAGTKWKDNRWAIALFGFLFTFVIYGGIMNFYATLSYTDKLTKEMLLATYAQGIPLDLIHAISTFVFLLIIAKPLLLRFERIKIKYGLM